MKSVLWLFLMLVGLMAGGCSLLSSIFVLAVLGEDVEWVALWLSGFMVAGICLVAARKLWVELEANNRTEPDSTSDKVSSSENPSSPPDP